ncbi:hypothetical protein H3C61_02565 [Candidatus Gracilibacteria bacterium]|nr:hypothetical protein [Candidatus Gracilibacteria bacterium]
MFAKTTTFYSTNEYLEERIIKPSIFDLLSNVKFVILAFVVYDFFKEIQV